MSVINRLTNMFVVDFIAASLLAFVLTILFAALVRRSGVRGIRTLPGSVWTLSVGSWLLGIVAVAFGPVLTGTHWLPFAITGLAVGLLVLALRRMPQLRRSLRSETGDPGTDARPAIALYFFVTLLLFFCAISLRFYLAHLA